VKTDVNTKYTVTGMTESGCVVTDEVNVLVMDESLIEVPNAFSPGNGANGKFKVLRRGDATLKSFTIFNRWGAKVFETSDINAGWDGTFNGEAQPMGVYIYTIDAVSVTGKRITKQGNVTLVR
jgi:gliding motility-associated-like protein